MAADAVDQMPKRVKDISKSMEQNIMHRGKSFNVIFLSPTVIFIRYSYLNTVIATTFF